LKTALIKQVHDVFGPWSGFLWKDMSPQKVLDVWPIKAVYWELTCILEADWYIIPQILEGDYIRDVTRLPGHIQIIEKYTTNIVPLERVPFSDYDLVISFDPILQPPKTSRTVFAYYAQEHWDRLYKESMQKPFSGYDLFLDHMMDAAADVRQLPQPLGFPYIHDSKFIRPCFSRLRQDVLWADWRTLMTLAVRGIGALPCPEAAAAARRLENTLSIKIRCHTLEQTKSWGIHDPPQWGDTADYFRELAECKYYVGVGDLAGAGQGLADAAALGCLCIGQSDKAYHRLLCHPSCLCEDIAQMPALFRGLANSPGLQGEVLAWQDAKLVEHFLDRPLHALDSAIKMKRKT
jgi:hypothetical protein